MDWQKKHIEGRERNMASNASCRVFDAMNERSSNLQMEMLEFFLNWLSVDFLYEAHHVTRTLRRPFESFKVMTVLTLDMLSTTW